MAALRARSAVCLSGDLDPDLYAHYRSPDERAAIRCLGFMSGLFLDINEVWYIGIYWKS